MYQRPRQLINANKVFGTHRRRPIWAAKFLVQFWVGGRQAKIGEHQAEASRISADAAMPTVKNAGNRAIARPLPHCARDDARSLAGFIIIICGLSSR